MTGASSCGIWVRILYHVIIFFYHDDCVLTGAIESTLSTRVERSTDEGTKTAFKHYQQAAGYFDFILSLLPHCSILTTSSQTFPCLTQPGVKFAKDLMLAQAQFCFYERVS